MVIDFSSLDLREQPVLILKNTTGTPIGVLGAAMRVAADIKFNEASVLEFDLPAVSDGEAIPFYDDVIGMRIVDLFGIGEFILMNPTEVGDGVRRVKSCKGYSTEFEFTFKKITLEQATYNFWNPVAPKDTVLGIIMELMPTWSIGHVDDSLIGKYRTFEVSNENLYNFIKGTAQTSYNCIFDFDTYNRRVNVRDVSGSVITQPIYISNNNLASEISVEENTENIVTRLDVNGAEGVDIRDVNPSGTNQLINLDYFMTPTNFDEALIGKYHSWQERVANLQMPYYNLSVEYALVIMKQMTQSAQQRELENERTALENEQAVVIQSIAMGLMGQTDLDEVNQKIQNKQDEISAKVSEIDDTKREAQEIYDQLKQINELAAFDHAFTQQELLLLDRYIKDDAISESSFVAQQADSYSDEDTGNGIYDFDIDVVGAVITKTVSENGKEIYSVQGGTVSAGNITAQIIHAALERKTSGEIVMSAYMSKGTYGDTQFPKGCFSVTGVARSVTGNFAPDPQTPELASATEIALQVESGYFFFTKNTSEYERRAVAWDLYEYGAEVLKKLSQPAYRFSVTSANFLCLEDFEEFRKKISLGHKLYVGIGEDETLSPICIGVRFTYDAPNDLTLEFGDTYISSDSSFQLADLLEQSVSMGKSVDANKYTYSAFLDSGASTKVKTFMNSALDVSKNAILSSKDQAISWTESGLRLRKWADDAHSEYLPHQVWMNNNSILMTSNNWQSAELAIGHFYDENLGECWGLVAPNIVGTLLAGSNLVIESAKKDGGVSVFRVDADGCVLYNSSFDIVSQNNITQISLDPQFGIVIGDYPVYTTSEATRGAEPEKIVDTDKAKFWVDTQGNLFFEGTLRATTGEFSGKVTALEGYIGQPSAGWAIGNTYIYNTKQTFGSTDEGVYIGVDGFSLGDAAHYIRATRGGHLSANSATITGHIEATSGVIGGCSIENGTLTVDGANITSGTINTARIPNLSAEKITTGTMSADRISGGQIDATDVNIVNLNASNITSGTISASKIQGGTLDASTMTVSNLRADSISVGQLTAEQIQGLPASKVVSGQFDSARIPNLTAAKITSGTFDPVLIPNLSAGKITYGTLDGNYVNVTNLNASNITTGTLDGKWISGSLSNLDTVYATQVTGTTVTATYLNCTHVNSSLTIGLNGSTRFSFGNSGAAYLFPSSLQVVGSGGYAYSGATGGVKIVSEITSGGIPVAEYTLNFCYGFCVGWQA